MIRILENLNPDVNNKEKLFKFTAKRNRKIESFHDNAFQCDINDLPEAFSDELIMLLNKLYDEIGEFQIVFTDK